MVNLTLPSRTPPGTNRCHCMNAPSLPAHSTSPGDSPKSYNQNRRKYHYRCIVSPIPLPVKLVTSWPDDACIFGSVSEGALKSFAVGAVPVGDIVMRLPRRASMRYYPRAASRRTCCCSCAHVPSYRSTTKPTTQNCRCSNRTSF